MFQVLAVSCGKDSEKLPALNICQIFGDLGVALEFLHIPVFLRIFSISGLSILLTRKAGELMNRFSAISAIFCNFRNFPQFTASIFTQFSCNL